MYLPCDVQARCPHRFPSSLPGSHQPRLRFAHIPYRLPGRLLGSFLGKQIRCRVCSKAEILFAPVAGIGASDGFTTVAFLT